MRSLKLFKVTSGAVLFTLAAAGVVHAQTNDTYRGVSDSHLFLKKFLKENKIFPVSVGVVLALLAFVAGEVFLIYWAICVANNLKMSRSYENKIYELDNSLASIYSMSNSCARKVTEIEKWLKFYEKELEQAIRLVNMRSKYSSTLVSKLEEVDSKEGIVIGLLEETIREARGLYIFLGRSRPFEKPIFTIEKQKEDLLPLEKEMEKIYIKLENLGMSKKEVEGLIDSSGDFFNHDYGVFSYDEFLELVEILKSKKFGVRKFIRRFYVKNDSRTFAQMNWGALEKEKILEKLTEEEKQKFLDFEKKEEIRNLLQIAREKKLKWKELYEKETWSWEKVSDLIKKLDEVMNSIEALSLSFATDAKKGLLPDVFSRFSFRTGNTGSVSFYLKMLKECVSEKSSLREQSDNLLTLYRAFDNMCIYLPGVKDDFCKNVKFVHEERDEVLKFLGKSKDTIESLEKSIKLKEEELVIDQINSEWYKEIIEQKQQRKSKLLAAKNKVDKYFWTPYRYSLDSVSFR